jgi:hypothetical protein
MVDDFLDATLTARTYGLHTRDAPARRPVETAAGSSTTTTLNYPLIDNPLTLHINLPTTVIMSSQELSLLKNFLLAPAALRDFLTLQQFTEIFPPAQRSSPAIRELYVEISRLRQQDIEDVRQNITDEVKRSKQLRREYARERRHRDDANVAGLDLVALRMEEEVS